MPRTAVPPAVVMLVALGVALAPWTALAAQDAGKPGPGDPGTLQQLVFETGRAQGAGITLAGRDAARQLVVTGRYSSGRLRDLTRHVKYEATPASLVDVDATG